MGEENAVSRGCFFCKSGKEGEVVRLFNATFPAGVAVAPTRTRYRRTRDAAVEERAMLLPGYVFFQMAEADAPLSGDNDAALPALRQFSRIDGVLKLLRYADGSWRLHGSDDLFAGMLFEADGNIGVSQAYFDKGNRIRIVDGFLKDYEGDITSVNRKMKTVEISIDLQGKTVRMRLGYELVEKA